MNDTMREMLLFNNQKERHEEQVQTLLITKTGKLRASELA